MSSYVDEKNRQPVGFQTTLFNERIYDIKKIGARKSQIFKMEFDSGRSFLTVPFTDNDGVIVPVHYEDWVIDFDNVGINESGRIGGILDGLVIGNPFKAYNIWAFADDNYNPKGFGVTQVPLSLCLAPAGANKGLAITFTGMGSAYRFTIGSRVFLVNVAQTVWNNGTIQSIDSDSSITVLLDSETYGHNLNSGVNIFGQWDVYRPYKPDIFPQETWDSKYKLLTGLALDATNNVYEFNYKEAREVQTAPVGTIVAFHKSLSGVPTLPSGWLECNGNEIRVDRSPLIGLTLPNLNGEGRFLRGSSVSGTLQLASSVYNQAATVLIATPNNSTTVYNSDGVETQTINLNTVARTNTSSGDVAAYEKVRPINMSVVYIMRVI